MSEKNPWLEPGEPARPIDIKSDKADLDMRLERKALAEGWDRTADKLDTALSQLAALREELAEIKESLAYRGSLLNRTQQRAEVAEQRLADAERRNAELLDLLRDIKDAPGGSSFRKHIEAAITKPEEAKS